MLWLGRFLSFTLFVSLILSIAIGPNLAFSTPREEPIRLSQQFCATPAAQDHIQTSRYVSIVRPQKPDQPLSLYILDRETGKIKVQIITQTVWDQILVGFMDQINYDWGPEGYREFLRQLGQSMYVTGAATLLASLNPAVKAILIGAAVYMMGYWAGTEMPSLIILNKRKKYRELGNHLGKLYEDAIILGASACTGVGLAKALQPTFPAYVAAKSVSLDSPHTPYTSTPEIEDLIASTKTLPPSSEGGSFGGSGGIGRPKIPTQNPTGGGVAVLEAPSTTTSATTSASRAPVRSVPTTSSLPTASYGTGRLAAKTLAPVMGMLTTINEGEKDPHPPTPGGKRPNGDARENIDKGARSDSPDLLPHDLLYSGEPERSPTSGTQVKRIRVAVPLPEQKHPQHVLSSNDLKLIAELGFTFTGEKVYALMNPETPFRPVHPGEDVWLEPSISNFNSAARPGAVYYEGFLVKGPGGSQHILIEHIDLPSMKQPPDSPPAILIGSGHSVAAFLRLDSSQSKHEPWLDLVGYPSTFPNAGLQYLSELPSKALMTDVVNSALRRHFPEMRPLNPDEGDAKDFHMKIKWVPGRALTDLKKSFLTTVGPMGLANVRRLYRDEEEKGLIETDASKRNILMLPNGSVQRIDAGSIKISKTLPDGRPNPLVQKFQQLAPKWLKDPALLQSELKDRISDGATLKKYLGLSFFLLADELVSAGVPLKSFIPKDGLLNDSWAYYVHLDPHFRKESLNAPKTQPEAWIKWASDVVHAAEKQFGKDEALRKRVARVAMLLLFTDHIQINSLPLEKVLVDLLANVKSYEAAEFIKNWFAEITSQVVRTDQDKIQDNVRNLHVVNDGGHLLTQNQFVKETLLAAPMVVTQSEYLHHVSEDLTTQTIDRAQEENIPSGNLEFILVSFLNGRVRTVNGISLGDYLRNAIKDAPIGTPIPVTKLKETLLNLAVNAHNTNQLHKVFAGEQPIDLIVDDQKVLSPPSPLMAADPLTVAQAKDALVSILERRLYAKYIKNIVRGNELPFGTWRANAYHILNSTKQFPTTENFPHASQYFDQYFSELDHLSPEESKDYLHFLSSLPSGFHLSVEETALLEKVVWLDAAYDFPFYLKNLAKKHRLGGLLEFLKEANKFPGFSNFYQQIPNKGEATQTQMDLLPRLPEGTRYALASRRQGPLEDFYISIPTRLIEIEKEGPKRIESGDFVGVKTVELPQPVKTDPTAETDKAVDLARTMEPTPTVKHLFYLLKTKDKKGNVLLFLGKKSKEVAWKVYEDLKRLRQRTPGWMGFPQTVEFIFNDETQILQLSEPKPDVEVVLRFEPGKRRRIDVTLSILNGAMTEEKRKELEVEMNYHVNDGKERKEYFRGLMKLFGDENNGLHFVQNKPKNSWEIAPR